MFGHKTYLALDTTDYSSVINLIHGSYEVVNFKTTFEQGYDPSGKAQTRVFGGVMHLTLPSLPPQPVIEWGMSPRMYKSGAIIIMNDENIPIQKVYFQNAACTAMEINYELTGKSYASTRLIISAEEITVGSGIYFTNEWEF